MTRIGRCDIFHLASDQRILLAERTRGAACEKSTSNRRRESMLEDPKALTSVEWNNIHMFLQWFWIYFPIVVTFGLTLLVAHAVIPSMVSTGQLPESTQKLRVPLTGVAALLFVAGAIILSLGINAQLDVKAIYDRLLI